MADVLEYLDVAGRSPFGEWFNRLDASAASKVATTLARIGQGNFLNVKGVGEGVYEYAINFGPGYRVYFGKDGEHLVILVGGAQRSGNRRTSKTQLPDGRITNYGRDEEKRDAFDPSF